MWDAVTSYQELSLNYWDLNYFLATSEYLSVMQVFLSNKESDEIFIYTYKCFLIFSSLKSLRTNVCILAQYVFLTLVGKIFKVLHFYLKTYTEQFLMFSFNIYLGTPVMKHVFLHVSEINIKWLWILSMLN